MRNKNFTLRALVTFSLSTFLLVASYAQNTSTGTGWGNAGFTEPIVLDENFSGFTFFGNWLHANNSNSKPYTDENTGEVIRGTNEGTKTINYLNSTATLTYSWDTCAFAPEWGVAYSVDKDGVPVDPDPTTTSISKGFVEIARDGYGTDPGRFIIDLSNLEFIEGIQYSHSSCGGKKRGFMLSLSSDAGQTWDTLRYQSGNPDKSFTRDPFDWSETANDYSCEPSGYGMLWEDALYLSNDEETKVWLKFEACNVDGPQAVRLHDFKVYGTVPKAGTGFNELSNEINIRIINNTITVSHVANLAIYSITGKLVKSANSVTTMQTDELRSGMYIVKVQRGNKITTEKFLR